MANAERVQMLVDALRSGEYLQIRGDLRAQLDTGEVGHCCLGVACVVYELATEERVIWSIYSSLPSKVRDWYDFAATDPVLSDDDCTCGTSSCRPTTATVANDKLEWDFVTIAAAFETRYIKATPV